MPTLHWLIIIIFIILQYSFLTCTQFSMETWCVRVCVCVLFPLVICILSRYTALFFALILSTKFIYMPHIPVDFFFLPPVEPFFLKTAPLLIWKITFFFIIIWVICDKPKSTILIFTSQAPLWNCNLLFRYLKSWI